MQLIGLKKRKLENRYCSCLATTTPFRKAKHIDHVIELLLKNKCDAAMTICETDYPAYWMLRKKNKKFFKISV